MKFNEDRHVDQNDDGISSAHAQKSDEGGTTRGKTSLDGSIAKVVSTLERRVSEFSKTSKNITVLAELVKHLTSEVYTLKRKKEVHHHMSQSTSNLTGTSVKKMGRKKNRPIMTRTNWTNLNKNTFVQRTVNIYKSLMLTTFFGRS